MKQIVVLRKQNIQNYQEVDAVFWLAVPVAQQELRAAPTFVSAYPGVSAEELAALRSGAYTEQVVRQSFTITATTNQIGTKLKAMYDAAQLALNAEPTFQFYGTFCENGVWTVKGA